MDFSQLKAKQKINYIGDSLVFGGVYKLIPLVDDTDQEEAHCSLEDRRKLVILEFKNDETLMFVPLDKLNPNDWELAE